MFREIVNMRHLPKMLLVVFMMLPAVSVGKNSISDTAGTIYLSCKYLKPESLIDTYIQLIIDQAKNSVVTGLNCKVSDVLINKVVISFKCEEELTMEIERLNGAFLATKKPEGKANGYCMKEKGPKF